MIESIGVFLVLRVARKDMYEDLVVILKICRALWTAIFASKSITISWNVHASNISVTLQSMHFETGQRPWYNQRQDNQRQDGQRQDSQRQDSQRQDSPRQNRQKQDIYLIYNIATFTVFQDAVIEDMNEDQGHGRTDPKDIIALRPDNISTLQAQTPSHPV